MRVSNSEFVSAWSGESVSPVYVVELSFDRANEDVVYLTSGPVTGLSGVVYDGVLNARTLSGTSQKIQPDKGLASIGSLEFEALDHNLTALQKAKLDDGKGLRGKRVRVWIGERGLAWSDFVLVATQIVEDAEFLDGVYSFSCADVQRTLRKDIFDVKKVGLLASAVGNGDVIQVYSTEGFAPVYQPRGSGITDAPNRTVGYLKMPNGCIVRYKYTTPTAFWGCEWGALGTKHLVATVKKSEDTNADNAPQVEEYVYIEQPAPMLLYGLLTGYIYGYPGKRYPDHWHLGVDPQYVRTSDFINIGADLWDVADADKGLPAVVRGQTKIDGKKFIEEQLLLMMGAFSPIYANGEMGLRRRTAIMSSGAYVRELNASNLLKVDALRHDMGAIINQIAIHWHYDPDKKEYRRANVLVDPDSIATHGASDLKELKFKTLHSSRHAYSAIKHQFDALRDAYAGPPLLLDVVADMDNHDLEVGDIVRVNLEHVQDYTGSMTDGRLDRNFEIQQIATDWVTGRVKLALLGSSQPAGALPPDQNGAALPDAWYSSAGVAINAASFPGKVLVTDMQVRIVSDISLNGGADLHQSVYYCDRDLTVDAGVTVVLSGNVQLRVKGFLQINGVLDGKGRGIAGAAGGQSVSLTGIGSTVAGDGIVFGLGSGDRRRFESANNRGGINARAARDNVAYLNLNVDAQGHLQGLPADIRGNGGHGGGAAVNRYGGNKGETPGGRGGAGGAGLLVVARGIDLGANGRVDTSGVDGELGSPRQIGGNMDPKAYLKSGSGAGGAPGAVYYLVDGKYNPPNVTVGNSTARYGVSPVQDGVYFIQGRKHQNDTVGASWDPSFEGINKAVASAYVGNYLGPERENAVRGFLTKATGQAPNMAESWHRVQILSGYQPPIVMEEVAKKPLRISVTESANTPRTPDGNISTLELSAVPPDDPSYSHAFFQYRRADGAGWTDLGAASPELTLQLVSDGKTYYFRAFGVSKSGKRSTNYAAATATVSRIETGSPDVREALPLVTPKVMLVDRGQEANHFMGRDAHFYIYYGSNYQEPPHFAFYEVTIYHKGLQVRREYITGRSYTYTGNMNLEDGASREFSLSVRPRGKQNQTGQAVFISVSNPAPKVTVNNTVAGISTARTYLTEITDPDFKSIKVYRSTVKGFTPSPDNLVYDGYTNPVIHEGLQPDTTYYFRLLGADEFGDGELTPEFSFKTEAFNPAGELSDGDNLIVRGNVVSEYGGSKVILGPLKRDGYYNVLEASAANAPIFEVRENGDVLLGDQSSGSYAIWDQSAAAFKVYGQIHVAPGSKGYASLQDRPSSLASINPTEAGKLQGIQDGATKGADWGQVSGIPQRFSDSATPGLNLTADYLGFHNGSRFTTYMDRNGHFVLNAGAVNNCLSWNGSVLSVRGDVLATSVAASVSLSAPTISGGTIQGTHITGTTITGGAINGTSITGATVTGSTMQTAGGGKRIVLSSATNEAHFYGDQGDGSIQELATIGICPFGSDKYVMQVGNQNPGNRRAGILAHSNDTVAIMAQSNTGMPLFAVHESQTARTSPAIYALNMSHDPISVGVKASSAGGVGVNAQGSKYAVYANFGGYGPFTGAHDCLLRTGSDPKPGQILVYGEVINRRDLSNVLHEVRLSLKPRQRGKAGVYVSATVINPEHFDMTDEAFAELEETYTAGIMNALGEGQILVCGESGDIEIGDYIVTSSRPGVGMRQEDDVLRSYTIAEAREAINWTEEGSDERLISCKYLCG
ncbi:hypothetical protein HCH_04541 [Hahella chejuensis KCTC 2396]|uniref:Fibronectin type-III domain-containing protein n=1 Tax=Hahella chejuensis (strain KCTC 2396) TaxID=349521 RepID=Q2SDN3_HAHCH|nr:fibronectin type III domain-containing protein [Hahella chejuensis]ABC31241.1 hypothetical protein HCH_04541 [Hahella chejuensis KCTC 2396]